MHIAGMKSIILAILLILSVFFFSSCKHANKLPYDLNFLATDTSSAALQLLDSLLAASQESKPAKLDLHKLRQSFFARKGEMDSVVEEVFRIQQIARRNGDSLSFAQAFLALSGEVDESKFRFLKDDIPGCIEFFARRRMHHEQATLMGFYAAMLSDMGMYEESQKLAFSVLSLSVLEKRDSLRAHIYKTIANNYVGNNSNIKSLPYFRQATAIATALKDSALLTGVLMDMGIVNYRIKNDSARYYYAKALQAIPVRGGKLMKLKILYNIAVNDFASGQKQLALDGFRQLLYSSRTDGLLMGEAVAFKALGFYHEAYGNADSAVLYLQKSVQLADSIRQPFLKIQALLELEKAFRKAGNNDLAFQQHKTTDRIKDSMFTLEKQSVIHQLEVQYDSEKKTVDNLRLQKDNTFKMGLLLIAMLVTIALLIFWWLERQRNRLLMERNHAYAVHMERYRAERISKDSDKNTDNQPGTSVKLTDAASPDMSYMELQHLFKVKAVYKEPKLKIEDVALMLNITPRQITSLLKERENQNFRQYVNKFRISEARRLMEDPINNHLKIEAIGEQSGFSSRTHFQKIFELLTGVTPGYYRKNFFIEQDPHQMEQPENG